MIKLQWNALRPGDHVLVHDDDDAMTLLPGEVAMITTTNGPVDLAIRIWPADAPSKVTRPRRLAVHLDPVDPAEDCWRCVVAGRVERRDGVPIGGS